MTLFLLAAIIVGVGCQSSTTSLTPTPAPTPNCPFDTWQFCPPGAWQCNCSTSTSNEYDPTKLLNLLLQYKPFADFYAAEIEPLGYTIRYFYNPDLSAHNARVTPDVKTHTAIVELGNLTPSDDLAFVIAHELAGILLIDNGYNVVEYDPNCAELYISLRISMEDMIWTPFRDSMLARYGFNVEHEFFTWKILPLFLLNTCSDANDPRVVLIEAFYYAQLVLYQRDVLGVHETPLIIDTLYQTCLPKTRIEGDDILALVDQYQYDTPQNLSALFKAIISKYGLEPCIRVRP